MIVEFANLSPEEQTTLYNAPARVAILIAGADGKIDSSEIKQAVNLTLLKKFKARKELREFYKEVSRDFEDKIKAGINSYPDDPKAREEEITEELKEINQILPKLDKQFASKYYLSLKEFAKRIAEASGGVLGYMAIDYSEAKLIDLKMIREPS